MTTMAFGDVPLLDSATGRFPDDFAPPSVGADRAAAEAARDAAESARDTATTQASTATTKAAAAETARAAAVVAQGLAEDARTAAAEQVAKADTALQPGAAEALIASKLGSGGALDAALSSTYGLPAHKLQLTPATTNVTPLITAAIAAGHRHIVIPYRAEPWPLTTRLDASDIWLNFEPGARISFNLIGRAMDLTRVRLTGASFTSPHTGPTSAADDITGSPYADVEAREVRLNDGCVVEGYYHENACHGLNITAGANISIRDASFKNIRHSKGWAAAIHAAGGSTYNIRITGVRIENCDRGIEVEAGVRDLVAVGGHQIAVYPNGYAGQPGDYATYTFVLDAHSHDGESFCSNIVYRNWLLEGCGGGITFIRSTGTNGSDMPRNCLAEDIRILGNTMTTGYEMVAVQGYSNRVRRVMMMGGAGITTKMRVRFWGGSSESNRLEGLRADAYALPLITVDDLAAGTILDGIRPGAAIAGSGWLLDIAGRYTELRSGAFFGVVGTSGYVRFQATADYSKIRGLDYSTATTETFAVVILIDGAEHVQVMGVQGANYATVPPIDVSVTSPARFANVTANNFDRASAGTLISIASGATRNRVAANVVTSAVPIIVNSGLENTVESNKRGNWVESAKGTATIADTASTAVVTHGVSTAPEVVCVSPRMGELIWVSAIAATTFTVSRVGTSGAHTFDWRADNNPAS